MLGGFAPQANARICLLLQRIWFGWQGRRQSVLLDLYMFERSSALSYCAPHDNWGPNDPQINPNN